MSDVKKVIDKFDGDYYFLSNFSDSSLWYEGIHYPTVEHAYQASKVLDLELRKKLASQPTAAKAKKMGRSFKKKNEQREDWIDISLKVMEDLLKIKFSDPFLKKKLLATGDAELIEGNWWGDIFYGVCNGVGENHLGKLLMKIRGELKNG